MDMQVGVLDFYRGQKVSQMEGGYDRPKRFHVEFLGLKEDTYNLEIQNVMNTQF